MVPYKEGAYLFGGFDGKSTYSDFYHFDCLNYKWTKVDYKVPIETPICSFYKGV